MSVPIIAAQKRGLVTAEIAKDVPMSQYILLTPKPPESAQDHSPSNSAALLKPVEFALRILEERPQRRVVDGEVTCGHCLAAWPAWSTLA